MKLMTIVGTRPELIRLSEVIKWANMCMPNSHFLVHTGQNYDYCLNEIFFKDLDLPKPDFTLEVKGKNLGDTLGQIISKSYDLFLAEKPDAILLLGDTNSALCAISAKRLKIPVFHMEAGNRCYDQNVPEEINRKIVDHISDVNICYTETSRLNLLQEGISNKSITQAVFVHGAPMDEVLKANHAKIQASTILKTLKVKRMNYVVVSCHREENLQKHLKSILEAIKELSKEYNVLFFVHPRTKATLAQQHETKLSDADTTAKPETALQLLDPIGFTDYIRLQTDALCVVSDSGTLSEESALCGFPAVLLRTTTERPEAIDSGSIVIGGISTETLLPSIHLAMLRHNERKELNEIPLDYTRERPSRKILTLVQSYTNLVNRNVWQRHLHDALPDKGTTSGKQSVGTV